MDEKWLISVYLPVRVILNCTIEVDSGGAERLFVLLRFENGGELVDGGMIY